MTFKTNDRVRMKYYDHYAYGMVVIVTETECKVLFDGAYDLAYWYYPKKELELVDDNNEVIDD